MMPWSFDILDISQPVDAQTACFPGDVPFSRQVTLRWQDSQVINLTAFTMSPHVGTHADAPNHLGGELEQPKPQWPSAGQLPLGPYLGPVTVVDVAPWTGPVTLEQVLPQLAGRPTPPERLLLRTQRTVRPDVFKAQYASIGEDLAQWAGEQGIQLIGIDTPSVDPVDSKTLDTHHRLIRQKLCWLENLDLSQVSPGEYVLVALPLKLMSLEASPVRAVLLAPRSA
jgi:arylformamidase